MVSFYFIVFLFFYKTMRATFYSLLFIVFLSSCKQKLTPEALQNLTGFWEITEVTSKEGKSKEFKINEVIDYFTYSNLQGKRYKVMPMYDDSIQQNAISEKFTVVDSNEVFYFKYSNKGNTWTEELIGISAEELTFKNAEGNEYVYKKRTDLKDTKWLKD